MRRHYPINPVSGAEDASQLPWFQGNPQTGQEGSFPPFGLSTDTETEVLNAQRVSGQADAGADLTQLGQAIALGVPVGTFGGSANALTAALLGSVTWPALATNMEFAGIPAAANTGGVTLTMTGFATAPGSLNLLRRDGTALQAGDLVAGRRIKFYYDGSAFRVSGPVSSDGISQAAAAKSPFNRQQQTPSTRTLLNATSGGYLNLLTGTYVKKSATSKLLVRLSTNLCDGGIAQNCAIARLTIGGNVFSIVTRVTDPTNAVTASACTGEREFTGIAAGSLSWSLDFGRSDATAWKTIINPTSSDYAPLPSSTVTSLIFEEVEP